LSQAISGWSGDKLVIEQKQAELDQWNLKLALDKNATSGHNDEHGEDHPVVVLDMQVIDQKTKELDEWKVKLEDDIKAT
jgi:hypothetical protein